jgi:hypothetical protein
MMNSGRMPACDISLFSRQSDIASVVEPIQGDNNQNSLIAQESRKGNRCGHNKDSFKRPKIFREAKRRPYVIEEAKRRVYAALEHNFRFTAFSGLFYHQDENGKGTGRKIRTERVEGTHSLTLPVLLHHLDIHRMACGHYDNRNEFRYYNYAFLENATDQNAIRIKREMKLLKERGILEVVTLREQNNDGSYRTKEVRIEFTDKIFEMLELLPEFLLAREEKAIKFHEKQARLNNNQKKREIYRKTAKFKSKQPKTPNQNPTLSSKLQSCIKRPPSDSNAGSGIAIRDKINNLVAKGFSVKDAMELIRNGQAPPH